MAKSKKPASVPPVVIVLGKDAKDKAHASYFGKADADLAAKAAGLMGMALLTVTPGDLATLAATLPQGRVFESGNAFVPLVALPTYQRLIALGEAAGTLRWPEVGAPAAKPTNGQPRRATAGRGSAAAKYPQPGSWADIAVGSLVLVQEDPADGWNEAHVVEVNSLPDDPAAKLLTVQYLAYPDYERQVRRIEDIGLVNPVHVLALAND